MRRKWLLSIAAILCNYYSLYAQAPVINGFNPASAVTGSLVSIDGQNFSTATSVSIAGTNAVIISQTATNIIALVMPGTVTGKITVTTSTGSVISITDLNISTTDLYAVPNKPNTEELSPGDASGSTLGFQVAISADGNTIAAGGFLDNGVIGAVWIYTRTGPGNSYVKEAKLVGTGIIGGQSFQGIGLALSADGKVLAIGGTEDNLEAGAVWMFRKVNGTWIQEAKLTGNTPQSSSFMGRAVALSADGNTLAAGAYDYNGVGAVYIYKYAGGVWIQQGNKIMVPDYIGTHPGFGGSLAFSADGKTLAIGGASDNSNAGAVWIFIDNSGTWTKQQKLTGANTNFFGGSISLSADGNTLAVGSDGDAPGGTGSTRVYTRSGSLWTPQATLKDPFQTGARQGRSVSLNAAGNVLVVGECMEMFLFAGGARIYVLDNGTWVEQPYILRGNSTYPDDGQGKAVAVSADGQYIVVGGPDYNSGNGAIWTYERTPAPVVTSFTPAIAGTDSLVKIYGQNLGGAFTVKFIGVDAQTVSVRSDTEVWAKVASSTTAQGPITVIAKGGTTTASTFTYLESPVVTTITPLTGGPGTVITITGDRLYYTHTVTIGGVKAASFTVIDDHTISATVADGASGPVRVISPGGATSYGNFNFVTPAPVITDFTPKTGEPGTEITITGSNLYWITSVMFGNTAANNFTVIDQQTIKATVAYGASGNVTVASAGGSSSLPGFAFILPQPVINSFTPAAGPVGTIITINGDKLQMANAVTINNTEALILNKNNNTIKAMVMPGSTSGGLKISVDANSVTAAASYSVINSLLPNQQEADVMPGDFTGAAHTGSASAVSADGTTMAVGGEGDNSYRGAVWIFTRQGHTWTQQGPKLSPGSAGAQQGSSVALSADGNTLAFGGMAYNTDPGAAWIYQRVGNTWILDTMFTGTSGSHRGTSITLSADGKTMAVGGYSDNGAKGAAWVYSKDANGWTEKIKLVPNGAIGKPYMGESISLSADGNVLAVGGSYDNTENGAVWIFEKGTDWSGAGFKLMGSGLTGSYVHFGKSVALSADAKTMAVGAYQDNNGKGAVLIFVKQGSSWVQQGSKLIPNDWAPNTSNFGYGLSISADGNMLAVSGPSDGIGGYVWLFTRSGNTWTQSGTKFRGATDGTQSSISLSANGNYLVFPSQSYSFYKGKMWTFTSGQTLPVHWGAFVGFNQGNEVILQWQTLQEENNSGFIIQRSADGTTWTNIGSVPASNKPNGDYYSFADHMPLKGNNYYRLSQRDIDGKTSYSKIILVTVTDIAAGIKITAIATGNGNAQVQVARQQPGNFEVSITDMLGRLLKQSLFSQSPAIIELKNVPGAVYLVSVSDSSHHVITRKVTVY